MVKLIKAGFRKDRTIMAVFLMIIFISTFLLHTGMLASMYPRLFDEYADEQHPADYIIWTTADNGSIDTALAECNGVKCYATEDMVNIPVFKFTTSRCSKERAQSGWFVQRLGDNVGYETFVFDKRNDNIGEKRIYINTYIAAANDLCIGDKMSLDTPYGKFEYYIAGIYQHLIMGNSYYYESALLDETSFRELQEAAGKSDSGKMHLVFAFAEDGADIEDEMEAALLQLRGDGSTYANGHGIELSRSGYTVVVNILAGFIAAFAVIIMAICFIMIVFTINNNISRDIINIGALRSVGHTVRQIRAALTAEFVILGAVGSLAGMILSYAIYPTMEKMFIRELCGIIWKERFYPDISLGMLAGVLLMTAAVAMFSTMKIKKLQPVTALRFGLRSNSFKKNHFPLSETRGKLNFLLALKSSMQNMGQNIVIFFMITAVAFVTQFSGLLFYNTRVDITNFQRMIQGDAPDAYVYLKDDSYESACRVIDVLSKVDGVSEAYGLFSVEATVGDDDVTLIYVTDPDCVYCGVYEGEIMREDNEVVIGSSVAESLGVGVGDEITVGYGENSRRYLITGLQQSVMNTRLYMTDKAAQALGVDTRYNRIRVRVTDATDKRVEEVLGRIDSLDDDAITETKNYYREQRSSENVPVYAVGFIVLIMIILSVATVLLVIRLMLKAVFIRKEREFGIKKAVGFTSTQLRYQLSLSLMPTTIIAAITGSVAGYILLNPLFTLILGGYGIRNANLLLQPLLIPITAISVTLLVFAFSFIMSGRMKKLSAYKLIQE